MKQSLKYVLCVLVVFMGMSACSAPDKDQPAVELSPKELVFTSAGTMQRLEVRRAKDWTVTAPDWVTCSPERGSGQATVTVTANINSGAGRSGTLTITEQGGRSASIEVRQESVDFSLSHEALPFDSHGTAIEMTIVSKYDWKIDIPEKVWWLTAAPSSGGAGETTVTFTPRPFDTREPRGKELIAIEYGTSRTFVIVDQTMPNEAPEAPELLYPADGATDVAVDADFSWKAAVDPDGDELTYELQMSADGGMSWPYTAATTYTSAKFESTLDRQSSYCWRVKVSDPFGGEAVSATATFRTGDGGGALDGDVVELQHETAGAPSPIHMVFMGDGYIAGDYVNGGAFDQAVEKAIDAIFSVEPYTTYRNYFRISAVVAHSEERGATVLRNMGSLGPAAQRRNTVFETELEGGGSTGVAGDYNKVFEYARKVPGITDAELNNTVIFLLINVNAYAGTCQIWSRGRAVAYCPMGEMDNNGQPAYKSIIVHEGAGHGFGRLLDEYRYYDEPIDDYERQLFEAFRRDDPWYGWNVSFTDDRDQVHWKQYFTTPGYSVVGLYEGAMLFTKGVWRPEYVSCMEDNRPYFNAPSREAIVRRIHRISGTNFDFNMFVSKDRIKSDNTGRASYLGGGYAPVKFAPLSPPVLIMDE